MRMLVASVMILVAHAADGDEYSRGRAGWGARTIPVPLIVQAEHGLVPGAGVLVLRVRPGGTADGLGVKPGDVVLDLNGHAVSSRADVRMVVRAAAAGDQLQARILSSHGAARSLVGEFKERLPRLRTPGSWMQGMPRMELGVRPLMVESPDEIAVRQNEELLSEARQLAAIRIELDQVRASFIDRCDQAWYVAFDLRLKEPK